MIAGVSVTSHLACSAFGQTTSSWLNPVDGGWTESSLWSTDPFYPSNGSPMGASYHAVIGAAGNPYTVQLSDNITVSSLAITSPDASLSISAGAFSVGTHTQSGGTMHVHGDADVSITAMGTISGGRVLLSGGALRTQPLNQYFLHGSNALFEQTGGTHQLQITRAWNGLTAAGGGTYRLSAGTLVISTPNLQYEAQSFIGVDGAGTFHQSGGVCRIEPNTPIFIGSNGDAFPPIPGVGTMIIEGGGTQFRAPFLMQQPDTFRDTLFGIGTHGFGNGVVRDGAYADLGYAQIGGNQSNGTLLIQSGAQVEAAALNVGWCRWRITSIMIGHGSGTLVLSGANSRLDIGSGTLGIGSLSGGSALLIVNDGTMTVAPAHASLSGNNALFAVTGGRVDLNGGYLDSARGLLISAGQFNINGGVGTVVSASIQTGGTMTFAGGQLAIGTATVAGGRARVVAGSQAVPRVSSISVTGSGQVDLADSAMVVDYTGASPLLPVRAMIIAGYNDGTWDGNGIASSSAAADAAFALGYAEAPELFNTFPQTFGGWVIDDTTVLVKYVRYGDANLDGVVNLADFNRLAANFGTSNALWSQGDFNYDGIVNLADFNRLATNFGLGASGPEVTPEDWSALADAIPEPATACMMGLVGLLVGRRRRAV